MADNMRTYRMIAETPKGAIAIDIIVRGNMDAIHKAHDPIRGFLDFGCGFAGHWVDQGTERLTYTVAVAGASRD